jgi:predicted  nucleic acid-binding Zn-ribbon protein
MDNASAQIEKLSQEVALLRDQLACAEAKILKCQADVAALEVVSKDEIVTMWKRVRLLDSAVAEIQEFIGPVVEKIFPNLLKNYVAVSEKFKAAGTYSEVKRD